MFLITLLTYKSGEVIGIFDYYSILTVFIRQNGNN